MRAAWATAALAVLLALAGCNINPPAPPPPQVTGTVTVESYGHQFSVGNVWNAYLTLDNGATWNGSSQVDLSNDGQDGCIFDIYVHDGDDLTVAADSFNSLDPADVTDNTSGSNLGQYPVPDWSGGC